jgi:ubiquinone/menaquinone biosynthesis C-methylase UbiE
MPVSDQNYLRDDQYKTAANLAARVDLHTQFSVNKYGWFRWVFDHFDLPRKTRLLEIACGRGDLWRENMDRLPKGWDITLTDFAEGMLAETKSNLAGTQRTFKYDLVDIQSIPFDDKQFEAVIANHMLYYVEDKPRAFREVSRVLKSDGRFFTTTIGERHMAELGGLLGRFFKQDLAFDFDSKQLDFLLENGRAQLEPFFKEIRMDRYQDALEVTLVEPLVNYIFSGRFKQTLKEHEREFREFAAKEIKTNGAIHIFKDSGIFICKKG